VLHLVLEFTAPNSALHRTCTRNLLCRKRCAFLVRVHAGELESVRAQEMRTPRLGLVTVGALFAVEGIIGLVTPEHFRSLVVWLQSPPVWPASIGLRAILGLLLLAAPPGIRGPWAVRAVGAITLVGAIAGMFFTGVDGLPHGSGWRVPAAALAIAGATVVWACVPQRPAP